MIVEILKDVFETSVNDIELDKLWNIIEDRHRLFLENDEDIDALMNSNWYNTQRPIVQEIIRELMIWSIQNASTLKATITISEQQKQACFSIKEAHRYLDQPFLIIVENSDNDGNFLDAIFRCFPKHGSLILEHKEEGWLDYSLGGGSTIKNVINAKMNALTSPIFTKEKSEYLHCFVLLDSDKKHPRMDLASDKKNIIAYLETHNIPYHILAKREMENYLPDEAIDTIPDNRDFIDAYLRLKPKQKDFFDLEKGFDRGRPFNSLIPQEVQDLYSDIGEHDKGVFRQQDLVSKYREEGTTFKSNFPKLFHNGTVTKQTLLKRCAHHSSDPTIHPYNPKELPDLVEAIAKLL